MYVIKVCNTTLAVLFNVHRLVKWKMLQLYNYWKHGDVSYWCVENKLHKLLKNNNCFYKSNTYSKRIVTQTMAPVSFGGGGRMRNYKIYKKN